MAVIRIQVQYGDDREKMVLALANSGYKVRVCEEYDPKEFLSKNFFVEFETDDRVSIDA